MSSPARPPGSPAPSVPPPKTLQPGAGAGSQQPGKSSLPPPGPPIGVVATHIPTVMQCPSCKKQVMTQTSYQNGSCTYLSVVGCILCGCVLGCCLLPLYMKDLQDTVHSCPECKKYIGTHKRL